MVTTKTCEKCGGPLVERRVRDPREVPKQQQTPPLLWCPACKRWA